MSLPAPSKDTIAVVTGASSGIGEQLAHELARRGHSLLLLARRADELERVAQEISDRHAISVHLRICDLADREARGKLRAELERDFQVSVLCNNAGMATFGRLSDADADRERLELELNAVAVQDLTLAVLPGMVERGSGALLVVGSSAGHQPMPGNATYSASKAFANSFYEALHSELQGSGISVTVLAPGPVRTPFVEASGMAHVESQLPAAVWVSAERCAREAIAGLDNNRRMVTPGAFAQAAMIGGRYTPRALLLPLIRSSLSRLI